MKTQSKLLNELILKSWWTILFFFICFFAYDQAVKRRVREEGKLKEKLNELTLCKQTAIATQEELRREIASQDDENWIELTLMQKLGLVPEGQTKVLFHTK